MTAEQVYPSIRMLIQQVQGFSERQKLENLILGAVESKEKRKARISAQLEKKERFRIKPKEQTKNSTKKAKQ